MLHKGLSVEVYKNFMIDDLEDLSCLWPCALDYVEVDKLRVAKIFRNEQFSERDYVWRVKLLIGSKDSKFDKWSPSGEGPYRIKR